MIAWWLPPLWLALVTLRVVVHCSLNGQKRDDKYDGVFAFVGALTAGAILWAGNFFAPLFGSAP